MNKLEVKKHYDKLIDEGNDPVIDTSELQNYMNKWDGQLFIEQLNLTKSDEVLEIGIGTGRIAIKIIDQCKNLTGIDLSPKTIVRAKKYLKKATLVCGDFLEYTFNRQFDVIYTSLTFLHFENKKFIIKKIGKLMKPNGRAVISLTKDKSEYLDFGNRVIKVYPTNLIELERIIKEEKLDLINKLDLEYSTVLTITKL